MKPYRWGQGQGQGQGTGERSNDIDSMTSSRQLKVIQEAARASRSRQRGSELERRRSACA
eukprot:753513-Hanusia_phi.AAC.1